MTGSDVDFFIHDLSEQIARERARLARLERLQMATQARLADPERQTAAVCPARPQLPTLPDLTPTDKVALFRRLFRGRDDVYPRLWVNAKTHRSGYAPACANEWVRDVCEKPRVKCGDCLNQRFLPVSDRMLLDHLRGRHVVGVYPLLRDETCWFIAAAALGSRVRRIHAIDTFVSADSPRESPRFALAPLDAGPVASALDNSSVTPLAYVDFLVALAETRRILLQVGTTNGGNDGSVFARYDVPDVPIGWPLRCSHSPAETVDLRDVANLAELVRGIAEQW